jgi:hypothetical protein
MIQGYEFDDHLEFCDDAVYVLAVLRRRGCVCFQRDDGPNLVTEQLEKAARSSGYFMVIRQLGSDYTFVIESDRFELTNIRE